MELDIKVPYSVSLPLKIQFLIKRERFHAGHMRFHILAKRIANGYIDHSHFAEFLKDSFEYAFARLDHVLVLLVSRTEPTYRQI